MAALQASGAVGDELVGIRLKNIVFIRPIVVEERPVEVHIGLHPQDNGEIAYEIYSEQHGQGNAEPVMHSQGIVVLGLASTDCNIDLHAVRAECNQKYISSNQFYEVFKKMGLGHGPGFLVVEDVACGCESSAGAPELTGYGGRYAGTVCIASERDGCGVTGDGGISCRSERK